MKQKMTSTKRTATPAKANKPKTHEDYLAAVTEDKRAALQKLRKAIKAAAPKAEECISYQIPAFRLNGKFLVAYGAGANHCAFYPGSVVQALKKELKGYDTSKGTVRFPADKPLPSALVRKLVKRRIEEKGYWLSVRRVLSHAGVAAPRHLGHLVGVATDPTFFSFNKTV